MPLDSGIFWNRPDFPSGQSGPGCREILNQVMDMKTVEISLGELDKILDTLDSRETIRGRVSHFLQKSIPYMPSFSFIGCSDGGILLFDENKKEYFVLEIIDDKIYKTILPNSGVQSWSEPWDDGEFEYIDLGFMFHIKTSCSPEQRRQIFFMGAKKGFAGRRKDLKGKHGNEKIVI